MKKIPIGIENFKEIINKDYYFIDKSLLIKDVMDEKIILYTRPRRFGKTLNMSMLNYFFNIKEKDNAYLFDNLEISKDKEAMKHHNQYPVIFITLKDMQRGNYSQQIEKYSAIIAAIVIEHIELISHENLDKDEKELMKLYKGRESSISDLQDAVMNISKCLEKCYNRKVIILIDEYDVPLQDAYIHGYYDEMVNFLRNVFSAALKTNDALEKGIMTGCLRIAKESIFTGFNNFKVYSIMDYRNSDYFGFRQEEVNQLLEDYQLSDHIEEVKEWYDGYLFGNSEIYNPWSTLMYIDRKMQNEELDAISFWANTSGNSLVYDYIKKGNRDMKDDFEMLVQGKSITKTIMPELTYRDMDRISNIYSFLLFTGYLKIKRKMSMDIYELVIPNK